MPIIIKEKLTYGNEKFNIRNDFNILTNFVDDFLNGKYLNRFLVLPGLRSVGKTTILYQLYDYLITTKNISQEDILFISYDKIRNITNCNILEVIEYYLEEFHYCSLNTVNKKLFLLIDESHYDKKWSEAGKIIYDQSNNIFTIFTGSSALKLEYGSEAKRRMLRRTITPLSYSQHLKLKFNYNTGNMSNALFNLLFSGEIDESYELERKINSDILNLDNCSFNDWENYFKFGGFPSSLNEENERIILEKLYDSVNTIIEKDLPSIKNINTTTFNQARRLLHFLAQKVPGEVSQNSLAELLRTSQSSVNSILRLLELNQLIFHFEPYVGSKGRLKKSWNYYFANPSIRHAINYSVGFSSMKRDEYNGILLENLVASSLFNAQNNENYFNFDVFFQSGKNSVDFLITKAFENPIPLEIGSKKHIKRAMNKFTSPHGIIISNTTTKIKKEDDVVYIPFKTFSLM